MGVYIWDYLNGMKMVAPDYTLNRVNQLQGDITLQMCAVYRLDIDAVYPDGKTVGAAYVADVGY